MQVGDHVWYTGDDGEERICHVVKVEGNHKLSIQIPNGGVVTGIPRGGNGGSGGGQTWRAV